MSEHQVLCRRVGAPGWLTLSKQKNDIAWPGVGPRQQGHVDWGVTTTSPQTLEPMMEASLAKLAQHPQANFTFSTANAKALIGSVVDVQPSAEELRSMLPGRSITILAPIAAPGHADFWCHVWRDPRGNLSHSQRFVERILVDELRRWVTFFGPLKIERGLAGELDLWLRREWSAAKFFDEAEFPPPRPLRTKSPEEIDKTAHDEAVKRAVRLNKRMLASQGRRYNPKTRSWSVPKV